MSMVYSPCDYPPLAGTRPDKSSHFMASCVVTMCALCHHACLHPVGCGHHVVCFMRCNVDRSTPVCFCLSLVGSRICRTPHWLLHLSRLKVQPTHATRARALLRMHAARTRTSARKPARKRVRTAARMRAHARTHRCAHAHPQSHFARTHVRSQCLMHARCGMMRPEGVDSGRGSRGSKRAAAGSSNQQQPAKSQQ